MRNLLILLLLISSPIFADNYEYCHQTCYTDNNGQQQCDQYCNNEGG